MSRFFEDFKPGDVIKHPVGRTVSQADNVWFSLLTCNTNPIHINRHYSEQTEFKQPLVNSTFTLALVAGLCVEAISSNAVNLGGENGRMPAPVFEGPTICARSESLSARASESRPNM